MPACMGACALACVGLVSMLAAAMHAGLSSDLCLWC